MSERVLRPDVKADLSNPQRLRFPTADFFSFFLLRVWGLTAGRSRDGHRGVWSSPAETS